jgi:cytochrome oxidase Cu insertion factor (SCO1/SenC/PrrC family)
MDNFKLLDKLDAILDDVDEILLSMDLDRETKRRLSEYSYRVFMEAEKAVCDKSMVDTAV